MGYRETRGCDWSRPRSNSCGEDLRPLRRRSRWPYMIQKTRGGGLQLSRNGTYWCRPGLTRPRCRRMNMSTSMSTEIEVSTLLLVWQFTIPHSPSVSSPVPVPPTCSFCGSKNKNTTTATVTHHRCTQMRTMGGAADVSCPPWTR